MDAASEEVEDDKNNAEHLRSALGVPNSMKRLADRYYKNHASLKNCYIFQYTFFLYKVMWPAQPS